MGTIEALRGLQKPSILFVDDEPRLLSSLKRMLRVWRDVVDAEFVESGEQAIELLSKRHFDVIVSDMRMPGMSGAELLKSIRRSDPEALRVVLSGQADTNVLLEALEATHRYLSKPCDIRSVEKILKDAVLGKFWVDSTALRKHIALLPSLPCQGIIVQDFRYLLEQGASPLELIEVVNQDLGLSLRLIHLAHALVPDRMLTSAQEAIEILGIELLKQGLGSDVINEISEADENAHLVAEISATTKLVARYAKRIAEEFLPADAQRLERAGYLSGVGNLVLLSCFGGDFVRHAASASNEGEFTQQFDSGRIGAFLLTLWGLGEEIPRIIAGETKPSETIQPARILAAAQHLARLSIQHGLREESLSVEALVKIEPFLRGSMVFSGGE